MQNKADQANGEKQPASGIPACSAESFDKQKAGWKKAIADGKKTVNDLITTVQTKETLSDAQKMEIASWAVQPAEGGAA